MPSMPTDASGAPLTNLTVYVLPHSHDDTGWQRNVDQYYEEEVRYIYDSVVGALQKDSTRKFIFVETAFFMRWWRDQPQYVASVFIFGLALWHFTQSYPPLSAVLLTVTLVKSATAGSLQVRPRHDKGAGGSRPN